MCCVSALLVQAVRISAVGGLLLIQLLTDFSCSTPEALQPPPEIVQATLQVTVQITFIKTATEAQNSAAAEKRKSTLMLNNLRQLYI